MLTKEELDRHMFTRGWTPVETAQPEFHNYRKVAVFGEHNAVILSICLQPDVLSEFSDINVLYREIISSAVKDV